MSLAKPIGGYFELETRKGVFPHDDALLLNTARNCLEYILKNHKVSKLYIPKYICDVMIEPLQKTKVAYAFYKLNNDLEIDQPPRLKGDEYLLYVNYFGVKDEYCRQLYAEYLDQLVIDSSQAFFSKKIATHTIYSPRKFFGIPDGGMLYTDKLDTGLLGKDVSVKRFSHLLKRIDLGAEAGYQDFINNDKSLNNQPIKHMSDITKRLLASIGYDNVKSKRLENFSFLNDRLGNLNMLKFDSDYACPMVYPFFTENSLLRSKLIKNKIFVATYWPNVFEWCDKDEQEYVFASNILPLPIDQRYDEKEMSRIVELVYEYIY